MQVSGERYDDKPEKYVLSHPHDALQYMMLGAGEGRSLIAGQKPVKAFNARKGFDILKERLMLEKAVHSGIDYKEIEYVFWWWWKS